LCTDYEYRPVQSIAEASITGHGTNIIVGISVGMKATFIPTITVAVAVLAAYHLGASTGIGDGRNAGLFGTAVATMGMLSNAVYILSMNNYGPIADNGTCLQVMIRSSSFVLQRLPYQILALCSLDSRRHCRNVHAAAKRAGCDGST
jgi:inorganic pyrophosphatase